MAYVPGGANQGNAMKICVVSDLHLEFTNDYGNAIRNQIPYSDVLVLAGDIITSKLDPEAYLEPFLELADDVIYVPGNHEYYGCSDALLQEYALLGSHYQLFRRNHMCILSPGAVELGGIRFVGATGWYNAGTVTSWNNDFIRIPQLRSFTEWAAIRDRSWLEQYAQDADVVITHFLPSLSSVATKYQRNDNSQFVVDYSKALESTSAKLWVHGHTHTACDYTVNGTRVVCNPRGYPDENPNWKPLVVDI